MATTPRDRILDAATRLLGEEGLEGVSTRAVSAAAGVQPQTIYRQYGDMQGLLDSVARRGFETYYESKVRRSGEESDPVAVLRSGWDAHLDFARANPALYVLMFGDPRPQRASARREIEDVLASVLEGIAREGRLRVSVDRGVDLVLAANIGAALSSIASDDEGSRSAALGAELREIIVAALVADEDDGAESGDHRAGSGDSAEADAASAARHAVALAVALPGLADRYSPGEHALLGELLSRLG